MTYRIGTMGFGYKQWAGVFYPDGLPASRYLEHYATRFDCVELDTTFHAAPPAGRFAHWASLVPAAFRFTAKMPKAVTHEAAPHRGISAARAFVENARELGDKLGCVLLQFGPAFEAAMRDSLESLLDALPKGVQYAIEFRHESWDAFAGEISGPRGIALVAAEHMRFPNPPPRTADFAYVRLIGVHNRYRDMNHEVTDATPSLARWAAWLRSTWPVSATAWVMFNNDYAGYSIASAERMREVVGLTGPVVDLGAASTTNAAPTLFDL